MNKILESNDNHKYVIYCKMEKNRPGTICVAYLMKYRKMTLNNAMERFTGNRFKSQLPTSGVTIKSQIRYLKYQDHYLSFNSNNQKKLMDVFKDEHTFIVSSILLKNPNKVFTLRILIFKKHNPRKHGLITLERMEFV